VTFVSRLYDIVQVTEDEEVMRWYEEVKARGHPDKKEGWPVLRDIASLRDICVTLAWVASAHHAAVNFSMYDFTAFMPNRSPIIRREMPQGDEEIKVRPLRTTIASN
jgi:lipoxygenase